MNKFLTAAAALGIAMSVSSGASATTIVYDLIDTPQNNLLDGGFYKYVPGSGFQTLSFEENGAEAFLVYDEAAGTVSISGAGYNLLSDRLETFNVSYDEVAREGDVLRLGDMSTVGTFGETDVFGKGFSITLGETLTADGWLTNSTGAHFGDFHFGGTQIAGDDLCTIRPDACGVALGGGGGAGGGTTTGGGGTTAAGGGGGQVPVPATMLLILAGLAGLFIHGRRRA